MTDHPATTPSWAEDDSEAFIRYGDIITPSRAEQLAMLTALIPARPDKPFLAVDLGCGAGGLSAAILERFPAARVLALDGSPRMLAEAERTLSRFGDRWTTGEFD